MKVICKHDLRSLTNLLNDRDLKAEFRALKKTYHRLRVRLRNNKLVSQMKHLVTLTSQVETSFPVKDDQFLEKTLQGLIEHVDKTLDKTLHLYSYTQQHLKVGHLIHHLIIFRACVSRIRVCLKAILIYACDILTDSFGKEEYISMLQKHECKLKVNKVTQQPDNKPDEEIGEIIDRSTLKKRKL